MRKKLSVNREIKTVRQQLSHGRSKAITVEIRGSGKKQSEKKSARTLPLRIERWRPVPISGDAATCKPEKPTAANPVKRTAAKPVKSKTAKSKKKQKTKPYKHNRGIEHLHRPSEPIGPASVAYTVTIRGSTDRYLLSSGMPGNEETDP